MKTKNNCSLVELTALDNYIFEKNVYSTHQALMNKLNIVFINKSKDQASSNLAKLRVSSGKKKIRQGNNLLLKD